VKNGMGKKGARANRIASRFHRNPISFYCRRQLLGFQCEWSKELQKIQDHGAAHHHPGSSDAQGVPGQPSRNLHLRHHRHHLHRHRPLPGLLLRHHLLPSTLPRREEVSVYGRILHHHRRHIALHPVDRELSRPETPYDGLIRGIDILGTVV